MTAPTLVVQTYGNSSGTEAASMQEATSLSTAKLQALIDDGAFTADVVADKFAGGGLGPAMFGPAAFGFGAVFTIEANISAVAASIDIIGAAPFAFRIQDAKVICTGTNGGGSAKLNSGTVAVPGTDITDAMVMAVDQIVTRAGAIDDSVMNVALNGTLSVIKSAALDKGIIILTCVRT